MSNSKTMKIQTEQDMREFCKKVNGFKNTFYVQIEDNLGPCTVDAWESARKTYDNYPGAQLKQGIEDISFSSAHETLRLREKPLIHPSAKIPEDKLKFKGPMIGVLANCIDSQNGLALLQIRGKGIESEYGFQNAAAGFGQFRRTLQETASTELIEETGIEYAKLLFGGKAVDLLPFIIGGYPQPLASFTFENTLLGFPLCNTLDKILEFKESVLEGINQGRISSKKEGHPFAVPYHNLERIAGELNGQGRFYGPIYDSIINSQRVLKDTGILS